jgi:hypothetical protein
MSQNRCFEATTLKHSHLTVLNAGTDEKKIFIFGTTYTTMLTVAV